MEAVQEAVGTGFESSALGPLCLPLLQFAPQLDSSDLPFYRPNQVFHFYFYFEIFRLSIFNLFSSFSSTSNTPNLIISI